MKTNSKAVRESMIAHILECVFDYNEQSFATIEEAREYIKSEFERVAGHPYNIKRFPNKQDRFIDYLNGLPFGFLMYYDDIAAFLNGLGINPEGKEYSGEKSTRLYHYLIFREVFK